MKQAEHSIDKNAVKSEFAEKLERLTKSAAFLDFCEEVYGCAGVGIDMFERGHMSRE